MTRTVNFGPSALGGRQILNTFPSIPQLGGFLVALD
jgi:hypothetical protein